MFSTLKYDQADKDSNVKLVHLGCSNRPQFASRSQHPACQACHSKKVKCSGQKLGCDRCHSKSLDCVYPKSKKRPRSLTLTKSSAPSPSTNPAELAAVQPSYTTAQLDQTISGPDLLPTSSDVVLHDIEEAAELQHPEPVNDFDGDLAFDAFWDTYMSGTQTGLEHEDHDMMRGGSSPSDLRWEPNPQPISALDAASLEHLVDFSHEPAVAHEDSSGGVFHVDSSNVEPLCSSSGTSDWSSFSSSSTNNASPLLSGNPFTPGFSGGTPPPFSDAAEHTDPNALHSRTPDSSSSSCCQCIQSALRILEGLETVNNTFSKSTFDRILSLKKDAISQCSLILACQSCTAVSALVVLLIVICEKLITSFETWSTRYQGRKPKTSADASEGEPNDRSNGKVKKLLLGAYEVDSEHEQCALLRCLAMVQLRNLHGLLHGLQEFAASKKWVTHQVSLASFVLRLKEAAAGLIARESIKID